MITKEIIIAALAKENKSNVFFFDNASDTIYHAHVFPTGDIFCMMKKRTSKYIKVIDEQEFLYAINYKCDGFRITEDAYYYALKISENNFKK